MYHHAIYHHAFIYTYMHVCTYIKSNQTHNPYVLDRQHLLDVAQHGGVGDAVLVLAVGEGQPCDF